MKDCGYKHHRGDCGPITHTVPRYFIDGSALPLCELHAKEWAADHPFNEKPRPLKK